LRLVPLIATTRESRRSSEPVVDDPLQQWIVHALRDGERALDELVSEAAEPAARVLAALSLLELQGSIESRPGQRYALR
jgi:predicted Rossmann fold nucleotide-binding protein DprA/Smf involved in DNA uptake